MSWNANIQHHFRQFHWFKSLIILYVLVACSIQYTYSIVNCQNHLDFFFQYVHRNKKNLSNLQSVLTASQVWSKLSSSTRLHVSHHLQWPHCNDYSRPGATSSSHSPRGRREKDGRKGKKEAGRQVTWHWLFLLRGDPGDPYICEIAEKWWAYNKCLKDRCVTWVGTGECSYESEVLKDLRKEMPSLLVSLLKTTIFR